MYQGAIRAVTGDIARTSYWVEDRLSFGFVGFGFVYSPTFDSWIIAKRLVGFSQDLRERAFDSRLLGKGTVESSGSLNYESHRSIFHCFSRSVDNLIRGEFLASDASVSILLLGRGGPCGALGYLSGCGGVWRLNKRCDLLPSDSKASENDDVELLSCSPMSSPVLIKASDREDGVFFEFTPGRLAVLIGSVAPVIFGDEPILSSSSDGVTLGSLVSRMTASLCSGLAGIVAFDDFLVESNQWYQEGLALRWMKA